MKVFSSIFYVFCLIVTPCFLSSIEGQTTKKTISIEGPYKQYLIESEVINCQVEDIIIDRPQSPNWLNLDSQYLYHDEDEFIIIDRVYRLIEQGVIKAFKRLDCAGSDSNFAQLAGSEFFDPGRLRIPEEYYNLQGTVHPYLYWTNIWDYGSRSKVSIEVLYVRLSRRANTAARISPSINLTECSNYKSPQPGLKPECCVLENGMYMSSTPASGWSGKGVTLKSGSKGCIDETIFATIEIFPEVFLSGELWIPSEERWARTPVEAVQYLVLHEIAHLEHFIWKEASAGKVYGWGYNIREVANDEETAWEFASSIRQLDCR